MFFGTKAQSGPAQIFQQARFNFIQAARIWYQGDSREDNLITLSDEFFDEVRAHPIPANLDIAKLLAGSPGALDFYLWLSYRSFTSKKLESIPVFGPFGLARQLGSVEYSRPRRFQATLAGWLREIRAVWPECPTALAGTRLQLIPRLAKPSYPTRSKTTPPPVITATCKPAKP